MTLQRKNEIKNLLHIFGVFFIFIGIVLLLPLLVLPFYPHELKDGLYISVPGLITIILGFILHRFKPNQDVRLGLKQDAVIVTGLWTISALISSIPFVISGRLNFTQAFFEAVSGWTTTGLSAFDVANSPKIFLMYRSIMQFFGGVGLVLVVVSALSETFAMKLYNAEGHSDKLLPNVAKSARMIMKIYIGYFIAGVILYVLAGMDLFDSINNCMAALSTGGFAVRANSFAYYDSFTIELITVILMILGCTNFFANMLLIQRKFKKCFCPFSRICFIK